MNRVESTIQTQGSRETTRLTYLERAEKSERSEKRPVRSRRKKVRPGNAYLGLGAPLGSARDRQRLRDRNSAERTRVERMLANAPVPTAEPEVRFGASFHPAAAPSTPESARILRAVPARVCPVCTSSKVVSDEVVSGATMRLSECLHCDHRWTERPQRSWAELGERMSRGIRTKSRATKRLDQPATAVRYLNAAEDRMAPA